MGAIKMTKKLAAVLVGEFKHRLKFYASEESAAMVELEVRIMTKADWRAITGTDREFERRWGACELDGGMVLAVRGVKPDTLAAQDAPFPERAAKIRKIRAVVLDALEEHADEIGVGYIGVSLGGDGAAEFNVDLRDGGLTRPAEARITIGPLEE